MQFFQFFSSTKTCPSHYCCTRKLLKETAIGFFVTFLSWVVFQLGGAPTSIGRGPLSLRLCSQFSIGQVQRRYGTFMVQKLFLKYSRPATFAPIHEFIKRSKLELNSFSIHFQLILLTKELDKILRFAVLKQLFLRNCA